MEKMSASPHLLRRHLLSISFLLVATLFATTTLAKEAQLTDQWTSKTAYEYITFTQDPSEELTIREIMANPEQLNWQGSSKAAINLGYFTQPHWFKINFRNLSQITNWMFSINYTALDHVEYYFIKENKIVDQLITGDLYPISSRKLEHRNLLFPIKLEADTPYTIILRIKTDGSLQLPITLSSERDFWFSYTAESHFLSLFFGCLIMMTLYNLFIYFTTRDNAYLLYVCYVVSFIAGQFIQLGLGGLLFWSDQPDLNEPLLIVSVFTVILLALQFASSFLQLKTKYPTAYTITQTIFFIYVGITLILLLIPYEYASQLISLVLIPLYAFGIGMPLTLWIKGERLARFFTLGWIGFILSAIVYTMKVNGGIDGNFITEHSFRMGALLEVVLFSFALADKINQSKQETIAAHQRALAMEQEKTEAQQRMFDMEHEAKQQLEIKVRERTASLEKANQRLLQLNTTDQLTGIKNRRYFDANLHVEFDRAISEKSPLSVLVLDIDHFKNCNDEYGHLVGDQCLTKIAQSLIKSVPNGEESVARFGGEEFVITLPNTTESAALELAEQIRKNIATTTIHIDDISLKLTTSIGTHTLVPTLRTDIESLIQQADEALYEAKNLGRNRIISSSQLSH